VKVDVPPAPHEKVKMSKRDEKSLANKAEWAARQVPARKPIGTLVGNKQRVQEFKEMLLGPVVGGNVIRKVIAIALDDAHPGQLAALKMCIDRQLPMSVFEDKKDGARTAITISITGVGELKDIIDE